MAERIGWDQYEIALLIEACEKVLSGKEEKKVLVKDLSVALRQRAINAGIEIDDIFRNENGITLQMTKMIYLLTDGSQGLSGASKDYSIMAQISRNESKRFQTILSEAHKQIAAKDTIIMDNKEAFAEWLQNVPLKKYNQKTVIDALEEGSQYCNAHSLCKNSFWDISDRNTFSKITSKLLSMRIFRIMHKNTALVLDRAVPLYREFLTDKEKKKESEIQPKTNDSLDQYSALLNVFIDVQEKYPEFVFTNIDATGVTQPNCVYIYPVNMSRHGNVIFEIWHQKRYDRYALILKRSVLTDDECNEVIAQEGNEKFVRGTLFRELKLKNELLDLIIPKLELAKKSLTTMANSASNTDEPIRNSLNKAIDYLKSKYSVQLAYDRTNDESNPHNDLLYKVYNNGKDIMWVYYICGSRSHYVSIETEPEYIRTVNVDAFDSVINRSSHPCIKLIFTDFDRISNTLQELCDSINSYFSGDNTNAEEANDSDEKIVSFSDITDYCFSKPTGYKYKNSSMIYVASWNNLYTEIMKLLVKDYPSVFISGTSLLNGSRIDIIDTEHKDILRRSVPITDNLSLEINISARDFVKRISNAAKLVDLTEQEIEIHYVSNNSSRNDIAIPNNTSETPNSNKDAALEIAHPMLYHKLVSVSKIYDEPEGLSLDRIMKLISYCASSNVVKDLLENVSWATTIGDDIYSFAKKPVVVTSPTHGEGYTSDSGFDNHLDTVWKMADATRRSYVSAIRVAEKFAREHHCENCKMYNCTFAEAIATMKELRNNNEFLEFNHQQHGRFTGAFGKFESYTGFTIVEPVKHPIEPAVSVTEEEKENYIRVLMQRYQSGMQFDSIDFDNFRDCYDSLFDEKIDSDDATLEKKLRQCGVFYNDRLFPADGIIDKATGEKLLNYLENAFASGKSVIYYKAIMTDMADDFAYCFSLTDEKMLRAYIEYSVPKNTYYFEKDYMSNDRFVKIDHSSEIMDYMLSVGKPLSYEEIFAELSHISADVIRTEIRTNKMFVMDSKEHYFHIDIFECDDGELDKMSEIINGDIEENGYAIWTNVFGEIQDRMPIFIENNPYLGSIGIRNAVSRKLSDKFNFDGAIISSISKQLSMADVYKLYAKHHPTFTAEEIYNFSKELDTVIYFNALYEVCIRVSETLFVSRESISIDVDTVDAAIGTYFSGNYMLVKDIDSFLVFPNVEYEWNQFLLEGFLLSYSKKYLLLNNGNSLNNVAGAIVKRNVKNIEFVDVCADVLANSDIALTKTKALDYLAEMNLITRRSYRDVDRAITLANQTRNRKG